VGQKCPECATPVGRSRVITAGDLQREQRRTARVSHAIIVVCVAVYAVSFLSARTNPVIAELVYGLGAQHNPLIAQGQLWRLFTSMFLHSPDFLLHIVFNMYALYLFGPPLEREVGSAPFAALYLASGLAGGALFYLLVPHGQAVGASGAIFGLFGAWLVASFKNRHTFQGRANLNALLVLLAINGLISFMPGIAWQAHLGGLVAGGAIVALWSKVGDSPSARRLRTIIGLAVAAVAFGIVLVT
jgi:membrane associated rhomboid family serine protease